MPPAAVLLPLDEPATFPGLLAAIHAQRITGTLTLVLHCKNGVPQSVDLASYQRVVLAPGLTPQLTPQPK